MARKPQVFQECERVSGREGKTHQMNARREMAGKDNDACGLGRAQMVRLLDEREQAFLTVLIQQRTRF